MKFLIDDCLTVELVSEAGAKGYEACHQVRIGKSGWLDWNIVQYAVDGDFILVTNNASDFRQLYGMQPIHPGLIIILPNVDRAMQRRLFQEALATLAQAGDLANRVLEVGLNGDEVTFNRYLELLANKARKSLLF
jgi:predicted nuclease of predicted toxin-antitoxin system